MGDTDDTPFGLPMQPTGSGVVDLAIAREREVLANEAENVEKVTSPSGSVAHDDTTGGAQADNLADPNHAP